MSVSSAIRLKKGGYPSPPEDFDPYGDVLPYAIEGLEKLADRIDVESPKAFVFEEGKDGADEDELDEDDEDGLQEHGWREASEGLETFRALLKEVEKMSVKDIANLCRSDWRQPDKESLLDELKAYVAILEQAVQGEDLFRIEWQS